MGSPLAMSQSNSLLAKKFDNNPSTRLNCDCGYGDIGLVALGASAPRGCQSSYPIPDQTDGRGGTATTLRQGGDSRVRREPDSGNWFGGKSAVFSRLSLITSVREASG